ncbi:hypothetical protein BG004_005808 [Podila humilis]|nr:hypothetical protein BG004_005808 [Podila humilis]
MPFINALDLDEIRSLIACYLPRAELLACALVSRGWRRSFLRYVWTHLKISEYGPNFGNTEHLLRYVQTLTYHAHPATLLFDIPTKGYSFLNTLNITGPTSGQNLTLANDGFHFHHKWPVLVAIINNLAYQTTSFTTLSLDAFNPPPAIWQALSRCGRLKHLSASNMMVFKDVFEPFWRTCLRLESLDLNRVGIEILKPMPRSHFLNLKRLNQSRLFFINESREATLPWVMAPHLESLRLVKSSRDLDAFRLQDMVDEIQRAREAAANGWDLYISNALPDSGIVPGYRLRSLEVISDKIQDRDVAFLVEQMDKLERLAVQISGQSLRTMCAIGRHRLFLQELDARHCGFDSFEILTVLESCVKLRVLAAREICSSAIAQSNKAWVCTGLERLTIGVKITESCLDPVAYGTAMRAVYQRLSGLRKLEYLDIAAGDSTDSCTDTSNLILRLDYGLDLLNGMKTLREVRVLDESYISLGVKEAKWMVHHWGSLRRIMVYEKQIDRVETCEVLFNAGVVVAAYLE